MVICAGPMASDFERTEIKTMLATNILEPTQTESASLVLLTPENDGTLRFFVDYRKRNAVAIRDSYPSARTNEFIDSLGDAQIFSLLDANSSYW